MDTDKEIEFEFFPVIRVYKSGRIERFASQTLPASVDPETGVTSKDVVIDSSTGLWVRLYLPKLTNPSENKLPVVVYYHGGAFMIGSAADPFSHNYLNHLVADANIIAVSVDYRLAPEHPLPIGYDDSIAGFKWVISHASGSGPEPWLVDHADFGRVFLTGCSAGGNMAHTVALRAGLDGLEPGVVVKGMVVIHPYFSGKERIGSEVGLPDAQWEKTVEVWHFVYPGTSGLDDPVSNPFAEGAPSLKNMVCKRVLVCVAEHDFLRDRGVWYCEKLKESEWDGEAELFESVGEGHAFHVMKPTCEKTAELQERVIAFLKM
ncbi:tuliposide A-converting enzyme 2 [Carex littledalei]|uniref:Tuliposide A-converting enzyme 2 n=1 Tax=Carex littledalei TaxID=544730 RepID=A0A833QKN7_9POAL|nr:tuliposide A-converting enzyme 2 [Carex littledalei]